jgi:hypothetical protein
MLKAEVKRLKKESEKETDKIRRVSIEISINLQLEQLKTEDLTAERDHLEQLCNNFRSLKGECFNIGKRCDELERTFSSTSERSQERKFIEGDIVGIMQWIFGEVVAFKNILSTRADYCAWIGTQSTASILLKAGCNHMKTCTDLDFEVSIENVWMSTAEASEWGKKFLDDIWSKGGKEISLEESKKLKEKV